MKPTGLISAGVLLLLIGAVVPAFAQQDQKDQEATKQEQQAKPEKQKQTKPEKQQEAKPAKQEKQQPAKPEKQQQAKAQPEQTKAHNQQQVKQVKATKQDQEQAKGQQSEKSQQAQGRWAHSGQKDSRGHVYSESKFGREHHARFEQNGGRFYNGRREYSYGGYWFYAGVYPPWFYQQEVYFIMGADGLWYAVAYGDASLTCQVYIE